MVKKLLVASLLVVLIVLVGTVGYAVNRVNHLQPAWRPPAHAELIVIDKDAAADRLAQGIRFATVSNDDAYKIDEAAFGGFVDFVRSRYPRVHETLALERVDRYGLLYVWTGTQPALPPVLLAAHMDVVPADAAGWTHPPFDGVIADGYVWGRGTLDDKNSLLAILESAETLLAKGWQPRRTLIFAFGHDEEIGGQQGAKAIAERLSRRSVKAAFTIDEGGAVTSGLVPGIRQPVASIMAGEKGYLSVRLTLKGEGGHSSTPPPHGVIARLGRAIGRLEDHPMPPRLIAPVDAMLDDLAPEMDWPTKLVVANRDWLSPLLFAALERSRTTNALIRTTTAPTMLRAGVKDNVLPGEAEAVVNFRLLPGDTIAGVLTHVREALQDEAIVVEPLPGFNSEAPAASEVRTAAFDVIAKSVEQVFPEALVTSGIVLGATDNRHYAAVREQGYGFSPMPYTADDEGRIHGVNERIAVDDYVKMIQFYAQLMRNTSDEP